MIERLVLRRWRAFDHVDIPFEPGTTFLVAPNGVGKTSLLLGLTWALFGEHSNVDPATCVRLGYDSAEATVTITIGQDHRLKIHRTVTSAGKVAVEYDHDGDPVDPARAQELLVDEFGAPLEIAARLAVIRGAGHEDGELVLREHLYDAFGVSGLRRAASTATELHKDAVAARKKHRTASRSQLKNRDHLAERAEKLGRELDELETQRTPLARAVDEALQLREAAAAWADHDAAAAAHDVAIDELLTSASALGLVGRDLDELAGAVSAARTANELATERTRQSLTEAQAQALAAETALRLLGGHDPSCPTCARPFHGDELPIALAAQNESLSLAQSRMEAASAELAVLAGTHRELSAVQSEITTLSQPLPEPASPRPTKDAAAEVAHAQDELRKHDELAGSLSNEREAIVTQLDNNEALQAAYAAERVAWRREALTRAAAEALTRTAERLANEHIEPLSQQVRWRWKALFGDDGLQLRPDGTIVRAVGDRTLPWSQLSSGEQIWARLVAALLVLRSSTTLPFAWLDEPLEHLDPRARRIVAADLASSTAAGQPTQMIVTTYEHTLARQLAEDLPGTHLRYINRTERPGPRPRRTSSGQDDDMAEASRRRKSA